MGLVQAQTEARGGSGEARIQRPQRPVRQRAGGEQMDVNQSQALTLQPVPLDERQDFLVARLANAGKRRKQLENFAAAPQVPAG